MKFSLWTILFFAAAGPALAQAPTNKHPVLVGVDQRGDNVFYGVIAAVRLYDRALTATELAELAKGRPDATVPAMKPLKEWLRPNKSFKGEADLNLPGDLTIEAWVKPAMLGMTGRIVDKATPGGSDGFILDLLDGNPRFLFGRYGITRGWEGEEGEWTHLAAIWAAGKQSLYINGRAERPPATEPAEVNFSGTATAPDSPMTLWWRRPASGWTDSTVLGNGRIGAMASGGVRNETIWLNEDTLWSGENVSSSSATAREAFPQVQKLLLERREPEAHALYSQKMGGALNECYMPLGSLKLRYEITGQVEDYRRDLNLSTGVATVRYRQEGVNYTRETFVSHPDQVLVVRFSADQPGKISFSATLTSLLLHDEIGGEGNVLRMTGRCPIHADPHYAGNRVVYDDTKGMRFAAQLQVIPDSGAATVRGNRIFVENSHAVTLVLAAATSYNGFDKSPSREGKDPTALCDQYLAAAGKLPFIQLRHRHVSDFRSLMDRVTLELPTTEAARRATNERLGGGYRAEDAPALTALYYQFGRYLLVSSSRPGSQPANLQGIWNRSKNPPWSANWTMNCNATFNYLGVEAANLSELHEPFIRLVREWSVDGARVAERWYGCRGWVAHHNCDLWRAACPTPGNPAWSAFICGGASACQALWEHYAFSRDEKYLREVWPTLRGAAEFFLDFLVKDPVTGYLVTAPDTNFENNYRRPDGAQSALCMAPTPSNQMVRQLFLNCITATKVLNTDRPLRTKLEKAVAQLPPTVVDPSNGEIQEYVDPDYKLTARNACELLSHWGLIWSDQVTPRKTPELAAAMRRAYEAPDRRPWVTGQVASWQGAFPANTFARLGDGDRVAEILAKHFQGVVQANFTAGFSQSEWEIDGNLGAMAAIGEMLLQSHAGEIELLPALPRAWSSGKVAGLRARGGFTVDIEWKEGKVTSYNIVSPDKRSVQVRVNGELKTVASAMQ